MRLRIAPRQVLAVFWPKRPLGPRRHAGMLRLNRDRRRPSPLIGAGPHPRPRAIDTANALQLCDVRLVYCGAQSNDFPGSMRTRRRRQRSHENWRRRPLWLPRLAERTAHHLLGSGLVGRPHGGRGRMRINRRRQSGHTMLSLDMKPKLPVDAVEIGQSFITDLNIDARSARPGRTGLGQAGASTQRKRGRQQDARRYPHCNPIRLQMRGPMPTRLPAIRPRLIFCSGFPVGVSAKERPAGLVWKFLEESLQNT